VTGRPTGVLLGLSVTYNPFSLRPAYLEVADLQLAERVAELRKPERRARILNEKSGSGNYEVLSFLNRYDTMYIVDDPPRYDQTPEDSIAAIARRRGCTPEEVAYEWLLDDGGQRLIEARLANFVDGNMDVNRLQLVSEQTLIGLGDGGAHYGMICDAGYPSFMLSYWGRDAGSRCVELPWLVRSMSYETAHAVGLKDRGFLAPGYKADINVIDHEGLRVRSPRIVEDLPGGGRRLLQGVEGYVSTIVSGQVTYRDGLATGALPGRLVRGRQRGPTSE
jgi:N-acyl-D-aspartate/D-glutamate deacylase